MIPLPAHAIIRFRFFILSFWVVVAAFALPHAMRVDDVVMVEGGVLAHSEAQRATRLIQDAFPQPVSHFFVITIEAPVPIDIPRTRALSE